ncbi:hypothetical protein BTS95_07955 [Campylobacter jejuni]|nr:hypothetical protein [Campylobacter jejuni]EAK6891626.1 hypothetical protein [Campylobacter jejuni]
MKNLIKLGLLSIITAGVFSACSSEPKSVEYYKDPKNAQELEKKVKECKKDPDSELKDQECANAYKAQTTKTFFKKELQNEKITDEEVKKFFNR